MNLDVEPAGDDESAAAVGEGCVSCRNLAGE
jgi:hypothetical protein